MMDEVIDSGAGTGNEPDMTALLASVTDGLQLTEGGEVKKEKSGAADNSTATPPPPPAAPTPPVAAPTPAPAPVPVAAATPPAPGATPAPPPADLAVAPKTWRPEAAAQWATVPETIRAEIHKREEDAFRGIEQYKADAGVGKVMKEAISPYVDIMTQHGINPAQHVRQLMQTHHTLATGTPAQKQALFSQIARDYGITLTPPDDPSLAPYTDPQVKSLQEKLELVQNQLQSTANAQQQATMAQAKSDLDAFAADPANMHFLTVGAEMAQLMQTGQVRSLREAYDKAVWINPVSRAAMIAAEHTAKVEAGKKAEAERVAAAKAAASANNRTRAKAGSAAAPQGSMEDTMRAAYKEIAARS